MSDISIPGLSSKYNTSKLVEDLVAAERIRLTRMEEQVEELNTTRSTWRQINRALSDLQREAKSLYGFENPFSDRNVISSNERVLSAAASRTAALDTYSIEIKQVATSDRFLTPSMDRAFRVESGKYTFTVGDRRVSLQYRGGTVDDFARRLTAKGEGIVRAATVRDTTNTQVLILEAVPTGSENRLLFEDDARDFAISTGMMRVSPAQEKRITPKDLAGEFLSVSGAPLPPQSVRISDESIHIQPSTSLRVPFGEETDIADGMVLEYAYRTVEFTDEDLEPPKPPGPLWPETPHGLYRGIKVRSSPNSIRLPSSPNTYLPPERVDDWTPLKAEGRTNTLELPPISQTGGFKVVRVEGDDLPSDMTALLIENDNTHRALEIKDIRLFDPSKTGDLEPVQAADTAGDAIVEFQGIEARRSTNMIDDLIEGVTLNLERPSSEPVDLKIEPNTETAKDGIIRFVFSYNQLLTKLLVLTSNDQKVLDELSYLDEDQRAEMEEQLGRFRGNTTLTQLRSRLQSIITNPYPTSEGAELTLLAQIGISTNASSGIVGSTVDYSKLRGYLEIDEEKLDSFLASRIGGVKDLFGSDTTGDLLINSGVAKALDNYLTPYTQTGGLTGNRIAGIEGSIEDTKEKIADYEEYLKDYEADLKRQYGTMEAMLNQLENSSKELDNFSRQQGGNR